MVDLPSVRRERLQRLVERSGFVRVVDASADLGVSEVTVRADLRMLEQQGALLRVHGGAIAPSAEREATLEAAADQHAAAKRGIGRAAAGLVASGESIYIDPGSTATALVAALVDRADLHEVTVVTSGLTIALALERALPRFTVLVTGGTLRPQQHSLVNPFAAPMLDALRLDRAFLGCNGVTPDAVTNLNLPDAEIKRDVIRRSRERVLIADASKIGRTELAVIGATSDFDVLVTAGDTDAAALAELEAAGMRVVVADQGAV